MRSNWISKASLKSRLLMLIIPIMGVYTALSLFSTWQDVVRSIDAAYDRSLLGAIRTIDANVEIDSGGMSIELPYRLFEYFQLTASGNVYFRVATLDGLVELGNTDLPKPSASLKAGTPVFYDSVYFGEEVRVGAYVRKFLDTSSAKNNVSPWMIQVAESKSSRDKFSTELIRQALLREGVLLLLIWVALFAGLIFGLKPLIRLVKEIKERNHEDLSPISYGHLPKELQPLVVAVNYQLDRASSLMEAKRHFIDDASHQLRTPLSVIRTQIDYAIREKDLSAKQEALIALSRELSSAIRGLNQLLVLAHSDATSLEIQAFDLVQVISDVALELLPLAKTKGMDLGAKFSSVSMNAFGDRHLIQDALKNIVHNAIEHGEENGVITIGATINQDAYLISVVDNGPGIPVEIYEKLGQRFIKGVTSKGSGLGMAIAFSIMQKHGGQLLVSSNQFTKGTEVSLQWPKK